MNERLFSLRIMGPALLIWFAHFCTDFMIGMWSIYKSVAGLDLAIAGLIAGVAASIGEGMQFIFGPLSDRGNRKTLIIVGTVFAMSSAFLGYTESYPILFVLFLLTCLGSGMFHPAAGGAIGNLSKAHRGFIFTLFASGGFIGLGTSHIIFSKVYTMTDGATYMLALPSLILLALLAITPIPEKEDFRNTVRPKITDIFKLFKDKQMRDLYIAVVANQAIYWAMIFFLPDLLNARGYPREICYGGANLFYIFGAALSMLPSGYLADKYSPRFVLFGSSLSALVFYYFLIFNPLLPTPMLMINLTLLGASLGVAAPVALALGTALHPEKPGTVSAMLMGLVWCLAEFIGPSIGGVCTLLFVNAPIAKALGVVGLLFSVSIYKIVQLPSKQEVEAPAE